MGKRTTPDRRELPIAELQKLDRLSVDEITQVYPVSRAWVYQRIRSGELPAQTYGRRRIVRREDFENLGRGE